MRRRTYSDRAGLKQLCHFEETKSLRVVLPDSAPVSGQNKCPTYGVDFSYSFAALAEGDVGNTGDRVISRRAVLRSISLVLGGLAGPLAARAQEPGRTYRLGALYSGPRDAPHHVAFFDELRRLGFVLGQNVKVDGYGLRTERFADFARELVNTKVDVILCGGDPAIRAAQ